jgi:hypothetical protein
LSDPDLAVSFVLPDDVREWLTSELRYPVLAMTDDEGVPDQMVVCFAFGPRQPNELILRPLTRQALLNQPLDRKRASLTFESQYDWVSLDRDVSLGPEEGQAASDAKLLADRYGLDLALANSKMGPSLRFHVDRVTQHH